MREKLIELLEELCVDYGAAEIFFTSGEAEVLADHLIANGVTVGKPLTEYLHPVDNYAGLKGKYLVFKADTGEQVVNCFVLRPDKDTAAVEALRTYATVTDNKTLSDDINHWVGEGETAQKWIPVTERFPDLELEEVKTDDHDLFPCLAVRKHPKAKNGKYTAKVWYDGYGFLDGISNDVTDEVTHWMPLPEPPKET